MSCNKPLKAFFTVGSDGKKQIKFYNSNSFRLPYESYPDENKIDIPCGQCVACRLEYSRQWAIRCVLESLKYEHNYFLTLTYSPEFIDSCKNTNFICDDDGVLLNTFDSYSLVKSHLQKFLKDLRRYFEYHYNFKGIRFFACGEYGDKTLRPHFHVILFNCPIPDLEFYKTSFNGDVYWNSEICNKIWKKGYVVVANCNYNTCAYVSRYMLKKQKGKSTYYDDLGLLPPFTLMSRDPGIAREYYDENFNIIYSYDNLIITNGKGVAEKVKPPKYYDRLYDVDCPEDMLRIKSKREESFKHVKDKIVLQTDLDYDKYLAVKDSVLNDKIQRLVRPIE